jgi:alpha-galactosidase
VTGSPPEQSAPTGDRSLIHQVGGSDPSGTGLVLVVPGSGAGTPVRPAELAWFGARTAGLEGLDVASAVGSSDAAPSVHASAGRALPLICEVSADWFGLPGLRGHRLAAGAGGGDWSTAFAHRDAQWQDGVLAVRSQDAARGLALTTELEAVSGGAVRMRQTVTNLGPGTYLVDGLDVMVPVPDRAAEVLDLTGRWGRERIPQRHPIRDGMFLREGRTGKPGPDSATVLSVGTAGFGFGFGEVWGVHLAWSGNWRCFVQRLPSGQTVLGAGELLLPGEIELAEGEAYSSPWAFLTASRAGLDGQAAQLHSYLRSLPAHPPAPRKVVCNVWEAVYFDHDPQRLRALAHAAAEVGVERFVLDDGWFGSRRSDRAGLGDWVVSQQAWPEGLGPLINEVHRLGMQFGLWFEPEMVNADSDLFRAHPDWVLAVQDRPLREFRNQLVLDLGRPEVRQYLFDQLDRVLAAHPIEFVKWDHNRSLGDGAGSGGRPGVHAQTLGFYDLLDRLRAAHPLVEWESCASGGARIDLAVLERTQRVWTSDMTDALSRQLIQRWTGQLVPPEYLGAHVSAPVNHQTGRTLSLDFRVATAFFGDLGLEWDITGATAAERGRLAEWIGLYKQHRPLLHGGRMVRVDSSEAAQLIHGVLADDRSAAVMAYVQLDEAGHDPVPFQVPGLDPARRYLARQITPLDRADNPGLPGDRWRGEGLELTGAVLAEIGLPAPQRWPQSVLLVHLQAL